VSDEKAKGNIKTNSKKTLSQKTTECLRISRHQRIFNEILLYKICYVQHCGGTVRKRGRLISDSEKKTAEKPGCCSTSFQVVAAD
jgi:hypothetical protein